MDPGELLRTVRRRHGLSQAQLAARARTSQAAISRIERGQVSPSIDTLATLLDLMGEELTLDATPIDYGHDRTLLRENLERSPAERVAHGLSFSNFVLRNRGAANVPAEFQAGRILAALVEHDVDFVLIGGLAGMTRGSSYPSYDVDIAYARDRANLERLAQMLRSLRAKLRGAPQDVPFLLDAETLERGAHFTFTTPYGALDILDRPHGSPPYEELKRGAGSKVEIEGQLVYASSLDHLIAMKEASGRPKDKLMATEYRVLSDELRARGA